MMTDDSAGDNIVRPRFGSEKDSVTEQALRLTKAFAAIRSHEDRLKVLELAEKLAGSL